MWFSKRRTRIPRAQRKPARRRLTVEALEHRSLPASGLSAALVADIVPGGVGSNPSALVPVNGTLFFVAADGVHGPELWKSDGTAAGTVLVKDINPGSGSSLPAYLTAVGGTLYFSADDGTHGKELWKSDGTAAGTVLVKDINPGSGDSYPGQFTNVDGTLFFTASDPSNGGALWKSDGTAAGTVLVKDLTAGGSLLDFHATNVGGTLYFSARDSSSYGDALWKSDGTTEGTVLVKQGYQLSELTAVNGILFFRDYTSLWKSDGTPAGTALLKSFHLFPTNLTNVGGTLYLSADDGDSGMELWKSDGTSTGTALVKDIFTGTFSLLSIGGEAQRGGHHNVSYPNSSSPADLTNVNGRLYFTATNGTSRKGNGRELWTSDGTAAGTVLVKDIFPGSGSSAPADLANVNGLLYFTATDGVHGRDLWQTDGTAAGTVLVQDINPGSAGSDPTYLVAMNNKLYFSADDGTHGRELWDPPPVEPPGGSHTPGPLVQAVPGDPNDWPMFGHDPAGTRYNLAETRLSPATVGGLQELWRFPTDGPVISTPAVVNDRVYAADLTGTVYALTRDGGLLWRTTLNVPNPLPRPLPPFSIKIAVSPLVTNRTVVIGDAAGQIQGLDVQDGHVRWTTRPPNPGPFGDQHAFQMILGAGTMVGNYVAFGVSSLENYLGPASDPNYAGYIFRGNVVLIDPADGRIVWQTFFVDVPTLQPDGSYGPSGATVWGSPAYDRASNTIFVGTGQHYGQPTTGTSDALIALDAATGAIKWVNQETPNDTWNITFGPPNGNDLDLGDSPQLYRLNGRLVVAAGQKSGVFHVVDAATGAEVSPPQQFLPPGGLGGFHTDSAAANGVNYAPGNHWGFVLNPPTPSDSGAVFAISGDGSTQLWKFDTASPMIAGVAVANGVVYFQEIGGVFHAVDVATGHELARVVTGSALSGPAVSRGQIYLGDGNLEALFNIFGEHPPGSIVALGLGGRSASSPSIAGPSLPGDPDSPPVPPATGADPSALAGAGVRAAHPGGPPLILPPAGVVRLDADTAGWGWLVGRTPRTDPELTTPGNQDEQHRRNRLTVLAHERGHDRAEGGGKSETLPAGVRRTPAAAVLDQVFAALPPGADSVWASDSAFALPQPKRRAGRA